MAINLNHLNTTKSPWFFPNQILTADNLQGMVDYLTQEHLLTRRLALGAGIVTGFSVITQENAGECVVTLQPGAAITTDGHLIRAVQPKWLSDPCEVTDLSVFDRLPEGFDSPSDILELTAETVNENEETPPAISCSQLADRVLIIYIQEYDDIPDKCFTTDCYEASASTIFAQRYLLVRKSRVQAWLSVLQPKDTTTYLIPSSFPLPDLKMPKVQLDAGTFVSPEALQSRYWARVKHPHTAQLGSSLQSIASLLKPWLPNPQPLWDTATYPTLLDWVHTQINDLDPLDYGYQYLYDVLRDLTEAYREFRSRLLDLLVLDHTQQDSFPNHIMVGHFDADGKVSHYRYRHHGQRKTAQHQARQIQDDLAQMYQRMGDLIGHFEVPRSSPPVPLRLTPSASFQKSLGKRAIPFYYTNQPSWTTSWSGKQLRNRTTPPRRQLGYWQQEGTGPSFVTAPLGYVQGHHPFIRIEGLQGMPLSTVKSTLETQVPAASLPFDVVYVPLTESDQLPPDVESMEGLPPGFNDLQEHYVSHKSFFQRTMKDLLWIGEELQTFLDYTNKEGQSMQEILVRGLENLDDTASPPEFSMVISDIIRQIFSQIQEGMAGMQNGLPDCLSDFDFLQFQRHWQQTAPLLIEFILGAPIVSLDRALVVRLRDSLATQSSADQREFAKHIQIPNPIPATEQVPIRFGIGLLRQFALWLTEGIENEFAEEPFMVDWLRTRLPEALNRGLNALQRGVTRVAFRNLQVVYTHYQTRLQGLLSGGAASLWPFATTHPGLQHLAGTHRDGTFIVVYRQLGDEHIVVADFTLPYRCCQDSLAATPTCVQPMLTAYPEFAVVKHGERINVELRDPEMDSPEQIAIITDADRHAAKGYLWPNEDGTYTYAAPGYGADDVPTAKDGYDGNQSKIVFTGFDVIPFTLESGTFGLTDQSRLHVWVWDGIPGILVPGPDEYSVPYNQSRLLDVLQNDQLIDGTMLALEVEDRYGNWIGTLNQAIELVHGQVEIELAPFLNREVDNYKALRFAWNPQDPTALTQTFRYRISQHNRPKVFTTVEVHRLAVVDDEVIFTELTDHQVFFPLQNDVIPEVTDFTLEVSKTGGMGFEPESTDFTTALGTRIFLTDSQDRRLSGTELSMPWNGKNLFWCNRNTLSGYEDEFFYRIRHQEQILDAKVTIIFKPPLRDESILETRSVYEGERSFALLQENPVSTRFPITITLHPEDVANHGEVRLYNEGAAWFLGYTPSSCQLADPVTDTLRYALTRGEETAEGSFEITLLPILKWEATGSRKPIRNVHTLPPSTWCYAPGSAITLEAGPTWQPTDQYGTYYQNQLGKPFEDADGNTYRLYRSSYRSLLRTVVPADDAPPYVEYRAVDHTMRSERASLSIKQANGLTHFPSPIFDSIPFTAPSLLKYRDTVYDEFVNLEERIERPGVIATDMEAGYLYVSESRQIEGTWYSRIIKFDQKYDRIAGGNVHYGLREASFLSSTAAQWKSAPGKISGMVIAKYKFQTLLIVTSEEAPYLQAFTQEGEPAEEWDVVWPPEETGELAGTFQAGLGLRDVAIVPTADPAASSDVIMLLHPTDQEKATQLFRVSEDATLEAVSTENLSATLPAEQQPFRGSALQSLAIDSFGLGMVVGTQGLWLVADELPSGALYNSLAGRKVTASPTTSSPQVFTVAGVALDQVHVIRTSGDGDIFAQTYDHAHGRLDQIVDVATLPDTTPEKDVEAFLLIAEAYNPSQPNDPGRITFMKIDLFSGPIT